MHDSIHLRLRGLIRFGGVIRPGAGPYRGLGGDGSPFRHLRRNVVGQKGIVSSTFSLVSGRAALSAMIFRTTGQNSLGVAPA